MKKNFIAVVVAAMMALGATGCATSNQTSSKSGSTVSSATEVTTSSVAQDVNFQK